MSPSYPRALNLSRRVLRTLVVLNLVYGSAILLGLVVTLVDGELVMRALAGKAANASAPLLLGMQLIMVVGIASVPIAHIILRRLLAMIDTVRAGDPFVVENGVRLHTIAWSLLGLELLHTLLGGIAAWSASKAQLEINWSFSLTPWIAVLLLFVLARVFDHGARMRADLEGTV